MKFTQTALAVLLGCVSFSSFATNDKPFQHQVSISAADSVNSDYDSDTFWSASYQYHFSPVSQEKGPYALNNWLAQTSELGATIASGGDSRNYGLDGKYVTDSKWFISANYLISDLDAPRNPSIDRYGVSVGYYLDDWTSISLSYDRIEFNKLLSDPETTGYAINASKYFSFENDRGLFLSGSFSYADFKHGEYNDDSTSLSISSDYYFNKSWSIGANYARDNDNDDTYGLQTSYFWRMSDSVSLITAISKVLEPDSGSGFGVGLNLTGRF
ncbi:hypothetical protein SOPP22_06740 [Shewanella sp. OPT22]|nr:hypothetical protein SOPP22_06740 [Shewanella sp. OPT22]